MTFFDRKESVMKVELTQYGKYLLSQGRFKPVYYDFFDDDIIYDSKYLGVTETRQEIQDRIKDTPRIEPQYTFSGAETQMKRNVELVRSGKEKNIFADRFIQTPEKHYSLSAPLGNSDIANDKNPSWNIKFLKGQILSTAHYTSGLHPTMLIPRIAAKPISYETFPSRNALAPSVEFQDEGESGGISDLNFASKRFEDGSFIQIKDDYILLDISEENTPLKNDSFDIEVYLVDSDKRTNGGNTENLIPLYFQRPKHEVENGILLDNVEEKPSIIFEPSFVQHYFNVFVDKEINPDTLCSVLSEEEIVALNQSGEFSFDCAEKNLGTLSRAKLMSDVTPEDIEEKC